MNKARLLPLLALTLAASSCNRAVPPPLEGARIGGDFTLTDEDGHRSGTARFAGQYRLVYFGYTFCPDVCPVDEQVLMKGLKTFEASDPVRASRVAPIFVTLDPVRDTPAVLRQWTDAFHPRLVGFTGSEAEIDKVAKQYAIYFKRQAPNAQGAYLVDHARMAVLFGPKGEPITLVSHDKDAATVAAELDRWVK